MSDEAARLPSSAPPRPIVTMLGHTTVVLVLLTFGYYMVPLRLSTDDGGAIARLAVSLLAFSLLAWVFRIQARWSRRTQQTAYLRIQWLLSALYLLVLSFALAYVLVAVHSSDQFVGISDRTDSLYYSVTIVGTVGFGDIYASGSFAQILVTTQMLFDLVYIGTALRMLSTMAPQD